MRKFLLCLTVLTSLGTTYAQTGKEWDNPLITSVNRETAHTIAIPVASEAAVADNDMTASPYYQSLDGKWKFQWTGTPTGAKNDWCKKDFNDAAWTNIDVPSSWQVW